MSLAECASTAHMFCIYNVCTHAHFPHSTKYILAYCLLCLQPRRIILSPYLIVFKSKLGAAVVMVIHYFVTSRHLPKYLLKNVPFFLCLFPLLSLLITLTGTALIFLLRCFLFGYLASIKFAFKSFEGRTLKGFVLVFAQNT